MVWDTLPYSLLWNIWLEINRIVFKNKETITRKFCNKAKNLTLETISARNQKQIDIIGLFIEERNFIGYILEKNNSNQSGSNINSQLHTSMYSWKVRLNEEEFSAWLRNNNSNYLFFNGASKSNPGIAGVGGVIYNTNGDIRATYEWGLGPLSNNRAEALTLY